jgi:hypothetical protein
MTARTLTLSEAVYQRLCLISTRAGKPPEVALDQALGDYESKLLGQSQQDQKGTF